MSIKDILAMASELQQTKLDKQAARQRERQLKLSEEGQGWSNALGLLNVGSSVAGLLGNWASRGAEVTYQQNKDKYEREQDEADKQYRFGRDKIEDERYATEQKNNLDSALYSVKTFALGQAQEALKSAVNNEDLSGVIKTSIDEINTAKSIEDVSNAYARIAQYSSELEANKTKADIAKTVDTATGQTKALDEIDRQTLVDRITPYTTGENPAFTIKNKALFDSPETSTEELLQLISYKNPVTGTTLYGRDAYNALITIDNLKTQLAVSGSGSNGKNEDPGMYNRELVGDFTDTANAYVVKKQTEYCLKNGLVDENGKPALLSVPEKESSQYLKDFLSTNEAKTMLETARKNDIAEGTDRTEETINAIADDIYADAYAKEWTPHSPNVVDQSVDEDSFNRAKTSLGRSINDLSKEELEGIVENNEVNDNFSNRPTNKDGKKIMTFEEVKKIAKAWDVKTDDMLTYLSKFYAITR